MPQCTRSIYCIENYLQLSNSPLVYLRNTPQMEPRIMKTINGLNNAPLKLISSQHTPLGIVDWWKCPNSKKVLHWGLISTKWKGNMPQYDNWCTVEWEARQHQISSIKWINRLHPSLNYLQASKKHLPEEKIGRRLYINQIPNTSLSRGYQR